MKRLITLLFVTALLSFGQQLDLGRQVKGTLPISNGGTARTTPCANGEVMQSNGSVYNCRVIGVAVDIEDGDNANTFTAIDTTARFDDSGDVNFIVSDGGAGGPDIVTATVRPDSVALNTDTTGNYVDSLSSLTPGISVAVAVGGDALGYSVDFGYPTLASNPAMAVNECFFGELNGVLCEGSVADAFEGLFKFPDVTGADDTQTILTNKTASNGAVNTIQLSDGSGDFISATGFVFSPTTVQMVLPAKNATEGGEMVFKGDTTTNVDWAFDVANGNYRVFFSDSANRKYQIQNGGSGFAVAEVIGALDLTDGGTKPTCSSSIRGYEWLDEGGAGVKDTVEICSKDAADAYAWNALDSNSGSGSPGGADRHIQFNDSSAFGGDGDLYFSSDHDLLVGGLTAPRETSAGRQYVSVTGSTGAGIYEMTTEEAYADNVVLGGFQMSADTGTSTKRYVATFGRVVGSTASNRGGAFEIFTKADGGSLVKRIVVPNNAPLDFEDSGTKPTCSSSTRGYVFMDEGAGGVKDTFEICAKDAADAYAWRTIY